MGSSEVLAPGDIKGPNEPCSGEEGHSLVEQLEEEKVCYSEAQHQAQGLALLALRTVQHLHKAGSKVIFYVTWGHVR